MPLFSKHIISEGVDSVCYDNLCFRVSPIGICSLIAAKVAAMEDIAKSLNMVGLYMATVICGLLIHALIIIPLLYLIVARKNPLRYYVGLRDAIITAFGTSSRWVIA